MAADEGGTGARGVEVGAGDPPQRRDHHGEHDSMRQGDEYEVDRPEAAYDVRGGGAVAQLAHPQRRGADDGAGAEEGERKGSQELRRQQMRLLQPYLPFLNLTPHP